MKEGEERGERGEGRGGEGRGERGEGRGERGEGRGERGEGDFFYINVRILLRTSMMFFKYPLCVA